MNHFRTLSLITLCLLLAHLATAQTRPDSTESGSSTANSVLTPMGTAPSLTGSGTKNFIPLWTSSTALGKSTLFQTAGKVGLGTTTPASALDVVGSINASLSYKIAGDVVFATPGAASDPTNIALGFEALIKTTGIANTATGDNALEQDTTGSDNTATGQIALENNTTGNGNTAVGTAALATNGTGTGNTAVGNQALVDSLGNNNTAVGYESLGGGIGNNNIALGSSAGIEVSSTSNNIEIGNVGSSTDSGTIRMGTSGTQTAFFAAGVSGVATGLNNAVPVMIDSNGQLGTVSSSRRFKEQIQDMGDASSDLMRLRPVTFRYKKPFVDGSQPTQYGLIAEEVAEVYPDLVARSADGQIETVKYQLLDPMLLNELQRQQAEIRDLEQRLNKIEGSVAPAPR
jgi:hypothetical protein